MTPTCYVHETMGEGTARLRTDLIECTSDDHRGWFRMWPMERDKMSTGKTMTLGKC